VVEDEPDVRKMAERILTKAGYAVLGTSHGATALQICARSEQPIALLLTDVIMPKMLGTELVEQARSAHADLRVVYMSGYSHELLAPQTLTENGQCAFVEKPFNTRALLETVRELLDRPVDVSG